MKKRLFALILAVTLVIGCAGNVSVSASTGLTGENMTKVLLTVKEKIGITDDFSVFSYEYDEYAENPCWWFSWNTEDYDETIYVRCDNEGRILGYDYYRDDDEYGVAAYTRQELLPKTDGYIAKLLPECGSSYKLTESSYASYRTAYIYRFVRVENGVEMPDNTIELYVDARDGVLVSLECSWLYDIEIPEKENIISEEKAADIIGENLNLELQYLMSYRKIDGEYKTVVFLAYIPDISYIAVDAFSGEVYTDKVSWETGRGEDNGVTEDSAESESSTAGGLTEAELEKIENLPELLSKEEAIDLVMEDDRLLIEEGMEYITAALSYLGDDYVWRIRMSDNRPVDYEKGDYYRAYANATVNAVTGRIESFNASVKTEYWLNPEGKAAEVVYSQDECRTIFEEFAGAQNRECFESTKLTSQSGDYEIFYDDKTGECEYGGYYYTYTRVNEDVPMYANYVSGSVDGVTGKIYNYRRNWTEDIIFESPAGAISEAEALDSYLGYDGYGLVYEVNTVYRENDDRYSGYEYENKVRLVYSTRIYPGYVDAFSGKQLKYNGEEYSKAANSYEYTDIAGTEHERAIQLLASMNIGIASEKFEPGRYITRDEFQALAQQLPGVYIENANTISGSQKLTRRYAAKAIIGYLGLNEIAKLNIFKTGFSDEDKITSSYIGCVALAKGLGIMDAAEEDRFMPGKGITRGEAAELLVKLLQAAKKGI